MIDERYATDIDKVFCQLLHRINRYEKQQRNSGHAVWLRYWSIAATFLFILSTGLFIYLINSPENNSMQIIAGATNGRKQYSLPDGSTVWLNRGSKLIYPSHFSGKQREVCLSGEAFFDVASDRGKKFIVKTGKLTIHVLGTKFDVKAYEEDNEIITSLVSGDVQISMENEATGRIALKPGEQLIHNKKNQSTTIYKNIDMDVYTSWKDGFLRFKQNSFQEVCEQLERAYGVRIQIKNPLLTERKYTGRFDLRNSIVQILEAIKITTPLTYTISGNDIIISN